MLHALVEVAEEERHVLGGQALDRDDRAVLPELLLRGGVDFLLDPGASKDLHRALVEGRGAWMDRRPAVPFDQEMGHAGRGEEQRGGQPHEAAAHHEHGNLALGRAIRCLYGRVIGHNMTIVINGRALVRSRGAGTM